MADSSGPPVFDAPLVGGEFGITAEYLRLADIETWQEGVALPAKGYYRMIPHPEIQVACAEAAKRSGLRRTFLATSIGSAFREAIHTLVAAGREPTVGLPADPAQGSGLSAALAADGLQPGPRLPTDGIWIVDASEPDPAAAMAQAAKHRIPVVVWGGVWDGMEVPAWMGDAALVALDWQGMGVVATRRDRWADEYRDRIRRRGPVVSARTAHRIRTGAAAPDGAVRDRLVRRLAELEGGGEAFLYPSGMNALAEAFALVRQERGAQVVVSGHLYTDTHILLAESVWPDGPFRTRFFRADQVEETLAALADRPAFLFLETITNPLNEVPDLPRLARVAREHGVPVVVDSTMASPANCRPLDWGADLVIHSTTKYLCGGNHHGGGATITRRADLAADLARRQAWWGNRMAAEEAAVLDACLDSFPERMERFNHNGRIMAEWLRGRPEVARVFAPPSELPDHLTGPGSVVSFVPATPGLDEVRRIYDFPFRRIAKAPSLGSDQTLICPYVILTYYTRDDAFLDAIRLPRNLIRLSVGSEPDLGPVLDELDLALSGPEKAGEKTPCHPATPVG